MRQWGNAPIVLRKKRFIAYQRRFQLEYELPDKSNDLAAQLTYLIFARSKRMDF